MNSEKTAAAGNSKRKRPPLSQAQLELMDILWRKGKASVTEVWEALPPGRGVARTTIMTLLVRLERKGWLKRRKSGNEFIYSAAVGRQEALGGLLRRLADTVFDGSAAGLVATLVSARGISAREAEHLRRVIDESTPETPARSQADASESEDER